ncbi:Alkylated DNA repair protein alkB 8 [Bonamia ostreae]|uniref:Alkylated DNA repair protein alkB 8 n=1 Tax=Bonamia ostreae TaxID=126728 RepID=A0ABV2AFC7_9EUKA
MALKKRITCVEKEKSKMGSFQFDKSKEPTKHLFVVNVSDSDNPPNKTTIQKFFTRYSKYVSVYNSHSNSCVNVTLDSVECALKAKIDSKRKDFSLNGRKAKISFSSLNFKRNINFSNQAECVCETKDCANPPGLVYIDNFVTEDEEQRLIKQIDDYKWISDFGRRVQHYGFRFSHIDREVDLNETDVTEIPKSFIQNFGERLEQPFLKDSFNKTDQITINEYKNSNGIRYHTDSHTSFKDHIFVLSLGAPIVMCLRLPDNSQNKLYFLRRRSMLILSDRSRFVWQHGIALRKTDRNCLVPDHKNGLVARGRRVSITYRRVNLDQKCRCEFAKHCDFRTKGKTNFEKLPEIEKENVHNVYSMIARHFSHTRGIKWPKVLKFLSRVRKGSLVVDIACGNGKYFEAIEDDSVLIGFDICSELIQIAKNKNFTNKKNFDVLVADALKTPLKSQTADFVISVALLHHLSTLKRRKECIKEMLRILKPNGLLFICAWAFEQEKDSRFKFSEQDCLVDWNLQLKHISEKDEDFLEKMDGKMREMVRIRRNNSEVMCTVPRYCHVYKKGELDKIVKSASEMDESGRTEIIESFYDKGNWCLVIKKICSFGTFFLANKIISLALHL